MPTEPDTFDQSVYHHGTVASFDIRGGYGYVEPDVPMSDNSLLLVHRRSIRDPAVKLTQGDRVVFRITEVPRGLLATDVILEAELAAGSASVIDSATATVIKAFNALGYGFIRLPDGRTAFFHSTHLRQPGRLPDQGTQVSCDLVETERGLQARNIEPLPTMSLARSTDAARATDNEFPPSEYLPRALLARDNRRYDEAEQLYRKGLTEAPTISLVLSYAAMQKNRGRRLDAMKIYEEGIRRFPKLAKLHEDAGILAASLGKYHLAVTLLRKALTICREERQAGEKGVLLGLGRTCLRMNTKQSLHDAAVYLEQALHLFGGPSNFPRKDLLNLNVARIRLQHHRGDLAYQFFKKGEFKFIHAQLLEQTSEGADLIVETETAELIESYGLHARLLVRCMFKSQITLSDLYDIDQTLASLGGLEMVDDQVALLIVASVPDDLKRVLFRRIEDRNRLIPAIVPIPQSVIETEESVFALRDVLGQWLYRRDLFNVNFPVVGRRFFGRNKNMDELRDAISHGTPVGVFGLRKVGKTSLLKELERRAGESGDFLIYMDLLRLPSDVEDFRWIYWKLASELQERVSRTRLPRLRWRLGGVFKDFLDIPEGFPVAVAFDADLTQVLKALTEGHMSPRPKVVFLLDEIERILPGRRGKQGLRGYFDFFSYLRGVSQESDLFALIITGANAAIAEASQFEGRDNPVFNFFREVYLQLLEPEECNSMLRILGRGMGIRFTSEALDAIYSLTGGHPFFSRQLCSFIADRYSERPLEVSGPMVAGILEQYLAFGAKDMREILDRLSRDYPDERDLCIELANAGESMPLADLIKGRAAAGGKLRHLVGYQVVRISDDQVYFSMDLLRRWLSRGYGGATH